MELFGHADSDHVHPVQKRGDNAFWFGAGVRDKPESSEVNPGFGGCDNAEVGYANGGSP